MIRTYYLITNVSGCKYWSYKVTHHDASYLSPRYVNAITKYGPIYINRVGGWMPMSPKDIIHKMIVSDKFPDESEENI